jgi:hypothetical protein
MVDDLQPPENPGFLRKANGLTINIAAAKSALLSSGMLARGRADDVSQDEHFPDTPTYFGQRFSRLVGFTTFLNRRLGIFDSENETL